jgi:CRISPR/Cas system CSM-associated protein Csm2 small subunit
MDIIKAVEVLQNQIQKLNAKDFDLNAWKNFTTLLLERIFGRETKKIEAIQNIKYDKGSWVLRDETGYANSMEVCKKLGREILEEAILELETFGVPEISADQIDIQMIMTALEDELTGTQFREIKKALTEEKKIEDKKKILITKLKSYGPDTVYAIVANILTNQQVSEKLIR